MSTDAGSMVIPNVEDGFVDPALRTDPSDALKMVWLTMRCRSCLSCLRVNGGGMYALGPQSWHFHGWCLARLVWTAALQDTVVHVESVSGSLKMLHAMSV
jgi:hypothetical protein